MTRVDYLGVDDVLALAQRIERNIAVRDAGLLDAAVHRPQASVMGEDAYGDLFTKAAALMQSLIGNHPFVDGNKRAGWLCAEVFLALNGVDLLQHLDVDEAERFTLSIADGTLHDVHRIAAWLQEHAAPAPRPSA